MGRRYYLNTQPINPKSSVLTTQPASRSLKTGVKGGRRGGEGKLMIVVNRGSLTRRPHLQPVKSLTQHLPAVIRPDAHNP